MTLELLNENYMLFCIICIKTQNSYIINYKNGLSIDLIRLQKSGLKGVTVDDMARFAFYMADLQNGSVIDVALRPGVGITPLHCSKMSMRLSQVLGGRLCSSLTSWRIMRG